jgi:hypothetical protein
VVVLIEHFDDLGQIFPHGRLPAGKPEPVELPRAFGELFDFIKRQIRGLLRHIIGVKTHGAFGVTFPRGKEENRFQFPFGIKIIKGAT